VKKYGQWLLLALPFGLAIWLAWRWYSGKKTVANVKGTGGFALPGSGSNANGQGINLSLGAAGAGAAAGGGGFTPQFSGGATVDLTGLIKSAADGIKSLFSSNTNSQPRITQEDTTLKQYESADNTGNLTDSFGNYGGFDAGGSGDFGGDLSGGDFGGDVSASDFGGGDFSGDFGGDFSGPAMDFSLPAFDGGGDFGGGGWDGGGGDFGGWG